MLTAAREVAAFILVLSAVVGAVAVLLTRINVLKRWTVGRFKQFIASVANDLLTARNGGGSLMDSIDRIELEIKGLHGSHQDILYKVDRLSSELALARELSTERNLDAENRINKVEEQLNIVLHAALKKGN